MSTHENGDPVNEKYIVFKRQDWYAWLARSAAISEPTDFGWGGNEVTDAVVIRRQDLFAPAALSMYAHAISIATAVLRIEGEQAMARRLQAVADYFHEQGELATDQAHKLPD